MEGVAKLLGFRGAAGLAFCRPCGPGMRGKGLGGMCVAGGGPQLHACLSKKKRSIASPGGG